MYLAQALGMALSGVFGVCIRVWLVGGRTVVAQDAEVRASVVTAREFRLVDEQGRLRGAFRTERPTEIQLLLDEEGRRVASLGMLSGTPGTSLRLRDPEAGNGASRQFDPILLPIALLHL